MTRLDGVSIVIVNNFAGPTLGGGEVQLLPVTERLLAEKARLRVVAAPGSAFAERCRALGAEVAEVPMGARHVSAAIRAIRAQLAAAVEAAADGSLPVLMGTGFLTNLLVRRAAAGVPAAVVNQVAVVPGASRLDSGSRAGEIARVVADRATAARVDRYVAVSEAVAAELAARGVPASRIEVVVNGVDPERLERAAATGVPGLPDGPVVSCIARLEPVKGVEYFVRAAAFVPDARFVVTGTGSQESQLREIAVAAGAGSPVTFLGTIPSAAALMARSDVVVVPSLSEAFGLVAAEAMALGKPVVASAVGGLTEVVEDGATGVLVPPADPEAIAVAVRGLLGDPDRAAAMGVAGRERVAERFSAERMTDGYVDLMAWLAWRAEA